MNARLIRLLDKLFVASAVALAAAVRVMFPRRARNGGGTPSGQWVVIKLVGMGDAVLALPALAAIRATPGCRLIAVTTPRCAAVWTAAGVADPPRHEAIVVTGWRSLWRAAQALRRCDGVLDFEQHVYWSAALAMLAPRQALRCGFRTRNRLRNRAYDLVLDPGPGIRHMKAIFDDLARAAGFHPRQDLLPLPITAEAAGSTDAWLRSERLTLGRYLVITPGSGATVAFRRLSAEAWAQVLNLLPPTLDVVLAGARGEAALIQDILRHAGAGRPGSRPGSGRLLAETHFNLQQLAHLFACAWKVVAIDSGPMHLAAAMGVPVVGIFGPDSPLRYAPHNPVSTSVSLRLACSPCNNCWVYRAARCTNPDLYACMRRQAPEMIAAAIGSPPGERRGAAVGEK